MPPPPNFFGRLDDRTEKPTTTTIRPMTTTTQKPYKQVLRPVYVKPSTTTTTTSTTIASYLSSQVPTAKSLKSQRIQTEPFRQHVVNPTRLPAPSTTTHKSVTQLKQINGQEILSFVPKEAIPKDHLSSSKGKPIYYEYFDARIKANVNSPSYISTTVPTTVRTLTQQHKQQQKQQQASKTQLHPSAKQLRRPTNAYLPVKPPSDYEKYVIITPKPENKPNAIASNTVQIGDNLSYKSNSNPLKSYNSEIDNIRHTIEFFQHQQKQTQTQNNSDIRNPKSKAVYEYSFDSNPSKTKSKLFHPPTEFDTSPFKPMVQYSLPLNADDGFKAIAYSTAPTAATEAITTTTTPAPPFPSLPPSTLSNLRYLPTLNENVSKKPHISFIPFDTGALKPNSLKHSEYSTATPLPIVTTPLPFTTAQPWISVEKQILREVRPKEINVQIQSHSPRPVSLLRGIASPYESSYVDANANDGQYNNQIYYPIRTPSSYYQQPTFTRPVMTAQQNAYLRQIEAIRQQLQQFPNQYHININNNSIPNQNYRIPRPLPLGAPNNVFTSYHVDSHRYPHLAQILSPNYNIPPQQQRLPQAIHPLHRDVLVNYKYPLPPIDPDSEYLPPPHLLHPLPPVVPSTPPYNRYGRLIRKPPTVVQYKLPGDQQAGVFFYTPSDGSGEKK